ncbi:hypothetical protein SASPL_133195 [Salvia splendens]|uniref:Uncharacterized protein n=1 Tax=Salvia splendens TaxID=180675 RepID=A0A8X8X3N7_SALSN|nr:hypothetical protein SASPL_133195 [Salvia splendens]
MEPPCLNQNLHLGKSDTQTTFLRDKLASESFWYEYLEGRLSKQTINQQNKVIPHFKVETTEVLHNELSPTTKPELQHYQSSLGNMYKRANRLNSKCGGLDSSNFPQIEKSPIDFNCLSAKNYVKIRRHKQNLWIQHADVVSGLAVDGDRGELYPISWDKSFKTWKTSSDMACIDSVGSTHSDAVNAVASSGGTVYTGSADGKIKVWRASASGDRGKRSLKTTLSKHD